jgi:Tfp pilus assembly pilus retraction ATPase PilT
MLSSVIQSGVNEGMCAMDDSLEGLLRIGKISKASAMARAKDKSRFRNRSGRF